MTLARKAHRLTHNSWRSMRGRCLYPKEPGYARYGGRGITVCDRWAKFSAFLEDMGERPSVHHTIDRKDPNLGYFKENCRWATRSEQRRNQRPYDQTPIRKNNSSGAKGVRKRGKTYMAQIVKNGRYRFLGTFKTRDEAASAYLEALHA